MILKSAENPLQAERIPRMSGDDPKTNQKKVEEIKYSPHERG